VLLHVVLPGGHFGGGFPSACTGNGLIKVPNNTIAKITAKESFFTVDLLLRRVRTVITCC